MLLDIARDRAAPGAGEGVEAAPVHPALGVLAQPQLVQQLGHHLQVQVQVRVQVQVQV